MGCPTLDKLTLPYFFFSQNERLGRSKNRDVHKKLLMSKWGWDQHTRGCWDHPHTITTYTPRNVPSLVIRTLITCKEFQLKFGYQKTIWSLIKRNLNTNIPLSLTATLPYLLVFYMWAFFLGVSSCAPWLQCVSWIKLWEQYLNN